MVTTPKNVIEIMSVLKGYQIFVGRIKKLRKQYERFLSGWEIWYALLGLIFVNAYTSGQKQIAVLVC